MTAVVADSPELRRDLRRAEKLGISHRRFMGWEPTLYRDGDYTFTEPEFDGWERALWRAYDHWDEGRCPGCGNSLEDALWDPKREGPAPKWYASFKQCRACEVLLIAQGVQDKRDEPMQEQRRKAKQPPLPTGHRLWSVVRDDEKGA